MSNCEEYQLNLSAMLDGELKGEALSRTVKHLAVCSDCLKVFNAFQSLQARVEAEAAAPPLPPHLWLRIEAQGRRKEKPKVLSFFQSHAVKYISAAAALFIFFALGYYLRKPALPSAKMDLNAPVVLAGNPGRMSEERFLEITRELLSAEPKYHRKMYLILHSLGAGNWGEGMEPPAKEDFEVSTRFVNTGKKGKSEIVKY